MNVNDKIASVGILPVIAVPSPEAAAPLAAALVRGGMCAVEVTLRNPWALDAIAAIRAAGVTNPSEIIAAVKLGLRTLKFFPAEISGGVAALALYHGPFPDVRFVPTGGMTFDNIGTYLAKPFVAACGGSWMAKTTDIKAGEWGGIAENCRRSVEIARKARGPA